MCKRIFPHLLAFLENVTFSLPLIISIQDPLLRHLHRLLPHFGLDSSFCTLFQIRWDHKRFVVSAANASSLVLRSSYLDL